MPLPATHIYYAHQGLGEDLPQAFLSGTVANDLRYVSGLPREATHTLFRKSLNDWEQVFERIRQNPDWSREDQQFYLGMCYHMFVDRWWRDKMYIFPDPQAETGNILKVLDEQWYLKQIPTTRGLCPTGLTDEIHTRLAQKLWIFDWYLKLPGQKFLAQVGFIALGKVQPWRLVGFVREWKRIQSVSRDRFKWLHTEISIREAIPESVVQKLRTYL